MSVLQRKIRNFLDTRHDLEAHYKLLIDSTGDPSSGLQDLFEFDQLCYLYHALKSYYDVSRSNWDLDYRNLLDDLASIVLRMEEKIPVAEILALVPQLKVVRRQLRENAREGGKVAFSMVLLNADMDSFQRIVMTLDLDDAQVKSTPLRQLPHGDATQETQKQRRTSPQEKPKPSAPQLPPKTAPVPTPISSIDERLVSGEAVLSAQNPPQTQPDLSLPGAVAPPTASKPKETPQTSYASKLKNTYNQRSTPLTSNTSYSSEKREAPQALNASFGRTPKRPRQVFFTHLNDWSPEHVQCIFRCAIMAPHRVSESIREGFKKAFGIKLSLEAAHALQLHYGILPETMNDYKYYMQTFHTVASKFFANRQHYVTEPWAELRKQFMRKTNLELSDSDVKGRYELYVLHRQTYGPMSEPPSSYEGPWKEFKRIYTFRQNHARDPGMSFFASANNHREASQSVPQPQEVSQSVPQKASQSVPQEVSQSVPQGVSQSVPQEVTQSVPQVTQNVPQEVSQKMPQETQTSSSKQQEWPAEAVNKLVRAQATTPALHPRRLWEVQRSLRESGFVYSLEEIILRLEEPVVKLAITELREVLLREKIRVESLNQDRRSVARRDMDHNAGVHQAKTSSQKHTPQMQSLPAPQSQGSPTLSSPATTVTNGAHKETPVSIPSQHNPVPSQPTANTPQPEKGPVGSAAGSPSSDSDLPKGVRRVSAKVGLKPNHFDNLIEKVAEAVRPNWHYLNRFKNLPSTAFWDFQKNLTITSTVDHISHIPENTQNPTERVARANLIKLLMLRFLRKHLIIVTEEFLEARLIKMMERDVFDSAACQLINDQIMKK